MPDARRPFGVGMVRRGLSGIGMASLGTAGQARLGAAWLGLVAGRGRHSGGGRAISGRHRPHPIIIDHR
jgi:hypothetical protein